MASNKNISQIRPGLYVGDIFAGRQSNILSENEIKGVVSLRKWIFSPESTYHRLGIIWKRFFIVDNESFEDERQLLTSDIFPWIKEMETDGKAVLIHCEMGISRSTACMITYLVWDGMSFADAFKLVREKHPITRPSFMVMESFLKNIGVAVPDLAEILSADYERAIQEIEKLFE